jgi:murein DD-endopeptidase MepM/ murein hydrolase activator NlpD
MVLPLLARGITAFQKVNNVASKANKAKKFLGGGKKVNKKGGALVKQTDAKKLVPENSTPSKPKIKMITGIKMPTIDTPSTKESVTQTPKGKVSFETLSQQIENIQKTSDSLLNVQKQENKATKELGKAEERKRDKEKARKREEKLEGKRSGPLGALVAFGKNAAKAFNLIDFITNVALGSLVVFLLNNSDTVIKVLEDLTNFFENPFNWLKSLFLNFGNAFKTPVKSIFKGVWSVAKNTYKTLSKAFKKLKPIVKKGVKNFANGLKNFVGNIINTGKNILGGGVKNATKTSVGSGVKAVASKPSAAAKPVAKETSKKLFGPGAKRIFKMARIFKRVPLIGPLISIFIDMLLGEPLDRAIVGAIGGSLGAWIGGGIGSLVFPFAGTAAGAILGGMIGDWAGKALYELIKDKLNLFPPPEERQEAVTQVVTGLTEEQIRGRANLKPGDTDTVNGKLQVWNGFQWVDPSQYNGPTRPVSTPSSGSSGSGRRNAVRTPTPVTSGGGSDFWTLVAVASREDGDDQGRADVVQSIYNRVASGAYGSRNIRDLILGKTQYQPTWDYPNGTKNGYGNPNDEWLNIVDAQSAAAASGLPVSEMQKVAGIINNPQLMKNAKDFLGGRTDFTNYSKTRRQGQIVRSDGSPNNYFGWDWNYKGTVSGNAPNFGTTQSQQIPQQTTQQPVTPAQLTQQPAQTGTGVITDKGTTTGARKGDSVSGFPVTSGYRPTNRPNHQGIDIGTPVGTYVALDVDVEIVFAGLHGTEGRGYGNVVDAWAPSLGLQFRLAHLNKFLCSKGQRIPAGVPLGQTGGASGDRGRGSSSGPHLHFEVDNVRNGTRYGGMGDPSAYVGHLILSSSAPTGQTPGVTATLAPSTGQQAQVTGVQNYAPYESGHGQTNVVSVPYPVQPPMIQGGGGGGVVVVGGSTKDIVNSYYKSQLMGFLYKQG